MSILNTGLFSSVAFVGIVAIGIVNAFNNPWGKFSSSPDEKFASCCRAIPLMEESVADACKYPPMLKLPYPVRKDISHHFSEYIGCYAQHKDNRACCIRGGVTGDFQVCQDFCDGTQHYEPDQKYYVCVDQRIESAISDCNKAAARKGFRQPVFREWTDNRGFDV